MDTRSITAVIVGLMVSGLILVAFVPIFTEVTATEKTFTNDGYFYVEKISADDTNEIVFTYEYLGPASSDVSFTYNGEPMDLTGYPSAFTIVTNLTDYAVRCGANEYIGIQTIGNDFAMGGHNTKSSTLTIASGTITFTTVSSTDVTATKTASYTELWVYSDTPTDYVMKKSDEVAYITPDTEYIACGVTSMTAWNTVISLSGNYEDFDATIIYPPNLTTTVTNKAIVEEEVDGYIDLYALDKLTFTINDGTTSVDAIYSYFIVPSEVTVELSVHGDDVFNTVINIIPLLAGVGLLMAGIYYFISRK